MSDTIALLGENAALKAEVGRLRGALLEALQKLDKLLDLMPKGRQRSDLRLLVRAALAAAQPEEKSHAG